MDWLNSVFWNNSVQNYLIFAGLFVGAWVVALVCTGLLRRYIVGRAKKTRGKLDDLVANVGARPLFWIVFLAGLHVALHKLVLPDWLGRTIWTLMLVAWTIVGAVFAVRLVNGVLQHYIKRYADRSDDVFFSQVIGMLNSAVGVVVWIIAALFLVANLGFNISSLLAGMGLGGLALAMASKDTLSNVFGSFTILVNGPFRVGEAVNYQGNEGTVELVGLRDTRIRIWNGNLVSVPNSLAPTSVITNISRRPSLRVLFKLAISGDTPLEKIDHVREQIAGEIRAVDGVAEKVMLHLLGFEAGALQLQVLYYITDTSRALDIQHEVNRRIKQIMQQADVSLASPVLNMASA
ncbi:MAG TPA: mechanosensitive ion channel family protein [Myxococcota bacterium]|nr:mechanosensitive ion channel family protein [Myxococcota bacterium]